MTRSYTQITGTFQDGTGAPVSGTAEFSVNTALYASGVPLLTPDAPITAQIVNGQLRSATGGTLQLLDLASTGISMVGQTGFWFWTVSVTAGGVVLDPWSFFLSHSSSPVDLYSLANTPAAGGIVPPAGDIGGTSAAPTVVSTHLAAALPQIQGGTGVAAASSAALLTALGALQSADNLSDVASATTARTNLGLGSAAVQPSSAFDAAGSAATAQANAESFATSAVTAETTRAEAAEALLAPLASPALTGTPTAPTQTTGDSSTRIATDAFVTTAVAAETTRAEAAEALAALKANNLSDLASASSARTNLGLGSAATQASSAFDAAGAAAAAQAASLPLAGGTMSGSIAMGAHKVTGLANGTASSDAAAFGQIPSLPLAVSQGGIGSATRNFAGLLTPTAVKTSAYSASAGDYVPCDTTSGSFTVTLPNAPADLAVVGAKHVIQGGSNAVTVACSGSDVFNKAGGATTATLPLLAQGMLLQYKASSAIWYIIADDLALAQLDSRYVASVTAADTSIVVGGTASAPTVATGTLDAVAAAHPPAANWSNNNHKITSVTNGSSAQDVAAYGQTPAGGATVTIGQGGTGQITAAAGYNALSPMTTKGDMEYDSAAGTAARLPIGTAGQSLQVSAGVPAWAAALTQLATTGTTPYTLVNGTGNILTWTAPSDGALHRVTVIANLVVTGTETGGAIGVSNLSSPNASTHSPGLFGGGSGAGLTQVTVTYFVQAGTTLTLAQTSALTGGAAVLWAELWGS